MMEAAGDVAARLLIIIVLSGPAAAPPGRRPRAMVGLGRLPHAAGHMQ